MPTADLRAAFQAYFGVHCRTHFPGHLRTCLRTHLRLTRAAMCSSNPPSFMYKHCIAVIAGIVLSGLSPLFANETVEFQPCELSAPSSGFKTRANCAIFELAENPDEPDLAKIPVHVARISATLPNKKADPLLFIAGGPGQSASESWPAIQGAFRTISKYRDVYLIDQRGTGRSNKLSCPAAEEQSQILVFDADATAETSRECLTQLPGDPRFYTTSIAVGELDTIRQRLEIEQWNIYGVSYGTRVALHYLRRFPQHVRTLTLDAAVPPGVALGPDLSINAEVAFQQMLERCANDAACDEAYPDLGPGVRDLLVKLREKPQDIRFENFSTGTLETLKVNDNHLALTMRMLSYSSHGVSILPNMLFEAYAKDNFAPFARQADMQSKNLGQSLASGMHNAVICTEDQPLIKQLSNEQKQKLADTYLGITPLEALEANCRDWPAGVLDKDFHEPVKSDKPILILSGSADPVTPPAYGERLTEHMPNALHIVNPFQGHMQIALGCGPTVVANFINRGNTKDVDYGCLERLRPEPFFINANGPRP